jgi:hypothetical protein
MKKAAYVALKAFVDQVPTTFSPKESLALMLALVYASKFVHAILSIVVLGKYDNVNATYRTGS